MVAVLQSSKKLNQFEQKLFLGLEPKLYECYFVIAVVQQKTNYFCRN